MPDSPTPEEAPRANRRSIRPPRDGGLVMTVVALVLALIAVGLAGWALLRTPAGDSTSAPTYTESEQADAKAATCSAVETVRRGVSLNTNLRPPGGEDDVTGTLAVAANARLALYDGGHYLLARLGPATPPDLADTVRELANNLMDIGAAATAGAPDTDPDQLARLRDADSANTKLGELCTG